MVIKKIIGLLGTIKTGFSLFTSFIGVNKIIIIVVGSFISFMALQQYRINSKDTKIAKQSLIIAYDEHTIKKISESNKITHTSLNLCIDTNKRINDKLLNVENKNVLAVNNINLLKIEHEKNLEDIKNKIKPVTICDNNFIDDDFADRMRQN